MSKNLRTIKNEIIGVIGIVIAIYIALSFLTYHKWDPSVSAYTLSKPQNYGGIVGSYISDLFMSILGFSSFLLPLIFFIYGVRRLLGKERKKINFWGSILLLISLSTIVSLVSDTFSITNDIFINGLIGSIFAYTLEKYLSPVGAFIICISIFFSSLVLLMPLTLQSILNSSSQVQIKRIGKKTKAKKEDGDELNLYEPRVSSSPAHLKEGKYILPSVKLLSDETSKEQLQSKNELSEGALILQRKLSDFTVSGKIKQINPGPVISMFEFEPDPGVKISKVVSIADDLGRALGGIKVRVSLIPGKTPIGIEVPNKKRISVSLREIVTSDRFNNSRSLLTIALGKDIYGNPVAEDLMRMPHLLVAGTTGSGKSVSVNTMIMSILFKARPSEVRMLMIDPKLLELSMYEGIPHLISHVITNPKEATDALKKMVLEMERRYRLIAERGARNIETFNVSVSDEERLPFIVVIIDELADLMFTASKSVEDSIVRLAQMARAAGIHLILATQRPSVDVITGIIKANFPTRIAFQVSSKIDSRTILDTHGAEKLLGKGDMLLLNPGTRIVRVHGAFVTGAEIKTVTDFIKAQGTPDYSLFEDILNEEAVPGTVSEERDEMYQDVIEYARSAGEVSISSIQRRFKIGYNRAARIMEMFEEDGLVGPPRGAGKPREFVSR